MAEEREIVVKTIDNSIMSLKVQIGTLSNGKPKYKSHSYSNVAVDATDADMYHVATQMATLFESEIVKITRQDIGILVLSV